MPIIRPAEVDDAGEICRIYNHYIIHTSISFEEVEVESAEMARRIAEVTAHLPWLVAENEGVVVGYAYATKWRVRSAYRFSVETSVYLAQDARGLGLGALLYEGLLEELRELGVHAVIGGIAQPNEASVRLHEKMGFHQVAMFEQVGFKNDRWVDVGYWQKLL
ncbi:arsinothricin resistance N-acetyltransferase ArsN1 family B [Undibacterium sp. TJN25]|uniref:arsinothricin resistance N-acetyltransferase ArsN1 family B n=1 Tax=Undibacterium sp. TJN25 TaxID=3413056 RepID=UPI003BF33CC7